MAVQMASAMEAQGQILAVLVMEELHEEMTDSMVVLKNPAMAAVATEMEEEEEDFKLAAKTGLMSKF